RLDDDDPTHWQADVLVEQPQALWNAATWPQI
ncbi:phosphoglycolate phosphatase, partial [Xanthomonas perforans]